MLPAGPPYASWGMRMGKTRNSTGKLLLKSRVCTQTPASRGQRGGRTIGEFRDMVSLKKLGAGYMVRLAESGNPGTKQGTLSFKPTIGNREKNRTDRKPTLHSSGLFLRISPQELVKI